MDKLQHLHPQSNSFLSLFTTVSHEPKVEGRLAHHLSQIWYDSCSLYSLDPPFRFEGLSAELPPYDHTMAERGGADYAANIFAHFERDRLVPLGKVPYPDTNGEFVLRGHRYVVPMFLRTEEQIRKMVEKDNDAPEELDKLLDEVREANEEVNELNEQNESDANSVAHLDSVGIDVKPMWD